ncbi:hypothetical protein BH09VER1_BH09VER1_02510 [soil metagenome]
MRVAVLGIIALLGAGLLQATQVDWDTDIYPQSNIFPSLIIGTACMDPSQDLFAAWSGDHMGDLQGVIGATIPSLRKGDKIKLVVKANELMKESKFEGMVEKTPKDDLVVHPKIAYDYDRLAAINQVTPLDVTMELFVNGESQGEKIVTVKVRSINDCLFAVDEDDKDTSDYSWLFAAYVNENHPKVDQILKEALQTGIVSAFDGYQDETDEDVLKQIFAIWNVMQRHGMKYSDITTTAAETEGVHSQHVRLMDQTLDATQANCVDGSVLLAALLRKIGLRASLVLVPEHMFLAVDLNEKKTIGIETTMMGEKSLDLVDRSKFPSFDKLAPKDQKASLKSFEGAVAVGTEQLEKDKKKFDGDDTDYQIIDLEAAREKGVLPIRSLNLPTPLFSMATPTPAPLPVTVPLPSATPRAVATATPSPRPSEAPTPSATPSQTSMAGQLAAPAISERSLDSTTLAGTHTCRGKNPDGSEYEGKVEIRVKNGLVLMEWTIAGKKSHGTGMIEGTCLGVSLDDGLAIYQVVPQAEGKSLIGRWAGEGAKTANEEVILIGETDVATAKFPLAKINGAYRCLIEKAKGGRDEGPLSISGGEVVKKVAQVKGNPGQGLLLGDGLAVITPSGLMVLEIGAGPGGRTSLSGHFLDQTGIPARVTVTAEK